MPRRSRKRKPGKPPEPGERLLQAGEQLAATGKRINRDPTLLAIVRSLRKVLPGDNRVADPNRLGGASQPRAVSGLLSEISTDRPGVLGEAGLGALQVWQSISEAQGRGRGKTELAIAFTDLVDFSTWALEAGDEAAIELLRDVSVAIEPPVKEHGGEVVKRLGDGMMAVFKGAPQAVAAISEGRNRLAEIEADGYK
ncbi:MAG: adenylate/guanylate cyclase domain-containing protein, partial [Solirubrobacterales bacterium]